MKILKLFFSISALLCTVPTAFLAFKNRFKQNLKDQCVDLMRKGEQNNKEGIRIDYRILARLLYGLDRDWSRIFMGPEDEIVKRMEHDKSDATRGLLWFAGFFACALLATVL